MKRKKQKMSFEQLPIELKSLVSGFCFKTTWEETEKSLEMCTKIKNLDISPLFLRLQMWSWSYLQFLPNPLHVFEPINRYTGRWSDIIDWHSVNELLYRLDYRRRIVKTFGTRHEWFKKFKQNWQTVRHFDMFYRLMLHSSVMCFKPTYELQRVTELSSWNSPFTSARWLLDDYDTWGSH